MTFSMQFSNEISYIQGYGAEDYGYLLYNLGRQNDSTHTMYLRSENQRSYAFYFGGISIYPNYRRFFANRYGQATYIADSNSSIYVCDSKIYPNDWDATSSIYRTGTGVRYPNTLQNHASSHNSLRGSSGTGWKSYVCFDEHNFKEQEKIKIYYNITRFHGLKGRARDLYSSSWSGNPIATGLLQVPANCTVKIKSTIRINETEWDGTSRGIDSSSPPYIIACYAHNQTFGANTYDINSNLHQFYNDELDLNDSDETADFLNSTDAQGKLRNGFIEYEQHTTSAIGAFETKIITVQPQYRSYNLKFGYYLQDHDLVHEGWEAEDIHVAMSKAPSGGPHLWPKGFAKVTVRPSANFSLGKKRISGRL